MIRKLKSLHKEAVLLSIVAVSTVCGFISIPAVAYYAILVLLLLRYLVAGRIKRVNKSLLIFLFLAFVGIVVMNPPAFFRSYERFGLFVLMMLVVSPLIESDELLVFRKNTLLYSLYILIVLSTLSLPCYYLGINFMVRENVDYLTNAGGFGGLFIHSMILGPMAASSAIMLFSKFIHLPKGTKLIKKQLILFLLICTIASTLISGSRTAVLGLFIVFAMLFVKYYGTSSIRLIKYSMFISIVLIATSSLWIGMFDRVMSKQKINIELGNGSFSSRESKWNARFYEIENSPLFGTGFASIDINSGDKYSRKTGKIEPGSSWLYLLSSTGILGFICFVSFVSKRYYLLYKRIIISEFHTNLAGISFFYALSMVTEGHIMSGGSYLCFLVWLSFGNSTIPINNLTAATNIIQNKHTIVLQNQ